MNPNICPHLVNIAQGKERPTFISPLNRCRAGSIEVAIGGATQSRVCLTPGHAVCPFATGTLAEDDARKPRRVIKVQHPPRRPVALARPLGSNRHHARLHFLIGAVLTFGLIAGLMAILPHAFNGGAVAAPSNLVERSMTIIPSPSPTTVSPTATPIPPTPTPTVTPTFTPTPTVTPTPTPTATPTPLRPPAVSPPTRLVISALEVDIPVVEVGWKMMSEGEAAKAEWIVADYAAGFHRTSAYPGRPGNTVISGHNNIRGEVFRDLEKLVAGDEIIVYVDETAYAYQVAETHVLPDKWVSEEQKRENAKWIGYFPEERLTLVTCWPYEGNSHRVIVVAKPVEPQIP